VRDERFDSRRHIHRENRIPISAFNCCTVYPILTGGLRDQYNAGSIPDCEGEPAGELPPWRQAACEFSIYQSTSSVTINSARSINVSTVPSSIVS
jgi:hypothetical protein